MKNRNLKSLIQTRIGYLLSLTAASILVWYFQYERQHEREKTLEQTEKLDAEWKELRDLMTGGSKVRRRNQLRGLTLNALWPRQNGRHFADDLFKCIFLNENEWISLKISLKFVRKVWINNIPTLVQIMAWRQPGDKPLSEPMMVSLLTSMRHSASLD